MMIGFSLITEGFGFHVPKGYLYAAFGFSVLMKPPTRLRAATRRGSSRPGDLRDRTADPVLRLLGGKRGDVQLGHTAEAIAERTEKQQLFAPEEKEMIRGVLTLADRPVVSIMTHHRLPRYAFIVAGARLLKRCSNISPFARRCTGTIRNYDAIFRDRSHGGLGATISGTKSTPRAQRPHATVKKLSGSTRRTCRCGRE